MAVDYVNALGAGSGLDTKAMVEAIVGAARAPYQDQIDRRKSATEVEISGLGQLAGAMTTLRSAMQQLDDAREFSFANLSNSNPNNIYATFTAEGAESGSHEIAVTQLARREVRTSDAFNSATTDLNGNAAATFTFQVGSEPVTSVTLDAGEVTLANLADAINEADAGAQATVLDMGDGTYRLFLESTEPGEANAITITSDLLNIGEASNHAQTALNAEFTYNGVAMERSSNQVTDLIQGVQLELMEDDGQTVRIETSRDNASAVAAIQNLVTAYNAFETIAGDLMALENEEGEKGDLYNDSAVRSLRNQVRAMFTDEGSTAGDTITRMGDMGVEFDRYGVLQLDAVKLEAALESNYDEVKTFFTADTDDQLPYGDAARGLSGDLAKLIDDYLGPGGLMVTREQANTQAMTRLEEDQAKLDAKMTALEERTTSQFTTMNKIMDEMKNLQSYLENQLDNLPFTKKDN